MGGNEDNSIDEYNKYRMKRNNLRQFANHNRNYELQGINDDL